MSPASATRLAKSPEPDRPRPEQRAKQAAIAFTKTHRWHLLVMCAAVAAAVYLVVLIERFHANYTVGMQSPMVLRFRWPIVIAQRVKTPAAVQAKVDQRSDLTPPQEYACKKFGPACRVALAIQRAENPQGKCEIYHYNSDGTLDWGYFQINTVHLKRRGVVLRDLLDCKANIDFAYQLYQERGNFSAWSTFNSGRYRRYLKD